MITDFPGEFTLRFRHNLHYTNRLPVPAGEVAEALLALERIVQRTPRVFRALMPGTGLPKVQLYVEELESGSILETALIVLIFKSDRQMNRTLNKWRKKLGLDLNTTPGVIRTIIFALIVYGAIHATEASLAPKDKALLEFNNNTFINTGTEELKITPEKLAKVIESAVGNKNRLASDAVKVIRPAKFDPGAEIRVDDSDAFKITSQQIALLPWKFDPDKTENSKIKQHMEIHLRAADRDNSDKGWAAIIPAVTDRRLPLELGPGVKGDNLFGEKTIHGTVEIISRKDANGNMQLRSYRLLSIDAS